MDGAAKRIVARRRNACRSRSAALNAGDGACKRASLSDRFALSRPHGPSPADPEISRNPSDLGEGVAPQNGAVGQQASRHALAYGKRAEKWS